MERAHVDITRDFDGDPVVHAIFDLSEAEIAASAHAVAATTAERFRMSELSTDQVLDLRELTALADELRELTGGAGTVVMRPARLGAFRDAVASYVESRDEAEWVRQEDAEHLAPLRGLLWPLDDLAAEAVRAALSPGSYTQR